MCLRTALPRWGVPPATAGRSRSCASRRDTPTRSSGHRRRDPAWGKRRQIRPSARTTCRCRHSEADRSSHAAASDPGRKAERSTQMRWSTTAILRATATIARRRPLGDHGLRSGGRAPPQSPAGSSLCLRRMVLDHLSNDCAPGSAHWRRARARGASARADRPAHGPPCPRRLSRRRSIGSSCRGRGHSADLGRAGSANVVLRGYRLEKARRITQTLPTSRSPYRPK